MPVFRSIPPAIGETRAQTKEDQMRRFVIAPTLMMVMVGDCAFAESTLGSLGVPGSIECDAFKKNRDYSWTSTRRSVVTIGSESLSVDGTTVGAKQTTMANRVLVGSYDLADVLNKTCR
jgi:hypothetical protein